MTMLHERFTPEQTIIDNPGGEVALANPDRPLAAEQFATLEAPNWAPWLRFSAEQLARQAQVFPEGQIILHDQDTHDLAAALSSNRIDWDGDSTHLPTWDEIAGEEQTFEGTFRPDGNTFALMSMSVNGAVKGRGLSGRVFDRIKEYAKAEGLEHIIGDFRPSNFGAHKQQTGHFDFTAYCESTREDGQPYDGWLRAVSRQGAQFHQPDPRAMVVEATADEVAAWSEAYNPEKWWEVTDPEQVSYLLKWHQPLHDIERVSRIIECGETGTWYIDDVNNKAVYIESNLWGEIAVPNDPYALPEKRLRKLEGAMVAEVKERYTEPDVYVAWIGPDHPYADVVRTLEARQFPEIPEVVSPAVEQRSLFMAVVDTRDETDRIIHAARLSGAHLNELDNRLSLEEGSTGFIVTDELIQKGELSLEDFESYCEQHGFIPDHFVSVETNFRVGGRVANYNGLRISDVGYFSFFKKTLEAGAEGTEGGVFASINRASKISLGAIGIEWISIPTQGTDDSDTRSKYELVGMPLTERTISVFSAMGSMITVNEVIFK
jgi:hypothetical protein